MHQKSNRLTSCELFLLIALAIDTASAEKRHKCCEGELLAPGADEGAWSEIYQALREKNILNKDGLTKYGLHRFHSAMSEGVNFARLAERSIGVAMAMTGAGVEALRKYDDEGANWSEQNQDWFANLSADLAFIAQPAAELETV